MEFARLPELAVMSILGLMYSIQIVLNSNLFNYLIFIFYFQNKNNLTGTGTDLGKSYMAFCRGNMDQIEKKIKDDLWVQGTFEVNRFF